MNKPTERDRSIARSIIDALLRYDTTSVLEYDVVLLSGQLAAARAEERMKWRWRNPKEWTLGTACLIACRGVSIGDEERRVPQISCHYGMSSLPAGTVAWMLLPEPPDAPP